MLIRRGLLAGEVRLNANCPRSYNPPPPISGEKGSLMTTRCLLVIGLCLAGGCRWMPNVAHPGRIDQQRAAAVRHDPFADNDIGPPVVGGRPREFAKPAAEPVRNRMFADSWWRK